MSKVVDTILNNATILLNVAHNATEGEGSHESHETHGGEEHHSDGVHIPGETIVTIWIMTCLIISAVGKILNKRYYVIMIINRFLMFPLFS